MYKLSLSRSEILGNVSIELQESEPRLKERRQSCDVGLCPQSLLRGRKRASVSPSRCQTGSRAKLWPGGKPWAICLPQRGAGIVWCVDLLKLPYRSSPREPFIHLSAALFSNNEATASDFSGNSLQLDEYSLILYMLWRALWANSIFASHVTAQCCAVHKKI